MKYLLDTCVISDFVKGEENTLLKIKGISPAKIAISSITMMEILYGLFLNPARVKKIQNIIHDFLGAIEILNFNQDDAREAALVRSLLKQTGQPIGSYDVLIAGTALSRKLTLVSANVSEFSRIEGLRLENWRASYPIG